MNIEHKKISLVTDRLLIEPLSENDNAFIFELVNTEGWLKFIGNRNVHTEADAIAYIQKINANAAITYWIVKLKKTTETLGIITFIKRDYLDYPDIGFAFLPDYSNKGYAFEATQKVLEFLTQNNNLTHILATTIPENISSINLLKKLGLAFDRTIEIENEVLHIYRSPVEELNLNG
jgi:[ribosomal protein S5]-alanine N-acetyltransferase